jgi:hypothetical protein
MIIYYKYVLPLVNAVLVTILNILWNIETETNQSFHFYIVFLTIAIIVSFLIINKRNYKFNETFGSLLKEQGLSFVLTFLTMYFLQFIILGIFFIAINFYSCSLPFCV